MDKAKSNQISKFALNLDADEELLRELIVRNVDEATINEYLKKGMEF